MKAEGDRLRREPRTWALTGLALLRLGLHHEAADWLGDWRSLEKAPAWGLKNLVLALLELGRDEELPGIVQAALNFPRDSSYPALLASGGFADAVHGDFDRAATQLRGTSADALPPYFRFFYLLAQTLLHSGTASWDERRIAFDSARFSLRDIEREFPSRRQSRGQKRAFRLAVWRIAYLNGGILARLWSIQRVLLLPG